MLAGYLSGRFGVLGKDSSAAFNRFVFVVSFPALVFVSLSRVEAAEFFIWPFLGALGGGMLATFLFSFLVARIAFPDSLTAHGIHSLTAMFASTAYIGLPLILIAFGDAALVPGITGAVITGALFMPPAIIIAEIDKSRQSRKATLAPLLGVVRNLIFVATFAGLAVSAIGVTLPKPVAGYCDLLGAAFIPCALFSAGLFMVGSAVKGDVTESAG